MTFEELERKALDVEARRSRGGYLTTIEDDAMQQAYYRAKHNFAISRTEEILRSLPAEFHDRPNSIGMGQIFAPSGGMGLNYR